MRADVPDAGTEEVTECEACGDLLPLCRCPGRCGVCLQWRERCKCRGNPRRRGGKNARNEWLCFECEEPLEYCGCSNRVYENLAKGLLGIKDPKRRKQAHKALVALLIRLAREREAQG